MRSDFRCHVSNRGEIILQDAFYLTIGARSQYFAHNPISGHGQSRTNRMRSNQALERTANRVIKHVFIGTFLIVLCSVLAAPSPEFVGRFEGEDMRQNLPANKTFVRAIEVKLTNGVF